MPSIEENATEWGERYDWSRSGDDWSAGWGGTESLWWGTIHPRVRVFLPASHILEIAPGYGRVTQFLHQLCDRLTVVDLNEKCIDACRRRFSAIPHIECHVNDGRSLSMVPDESVDLALTFDSLVHADADVIESYLRQLATKLTPDGVAFIHHSNAGAFLLPLERLGRQLHAEGVSGTVSRRLNRNWRAGDMTLARFAAICEGVGVRCVGQETVNWHSRLLNDCFSTVTRPGSRWDRDRRISRNLRFMQEVRRVGALARLYGPEGFPSSPSSPVAVEDDG